MNTIFCCNCKKKYLCNKLQYYHWTWFRIVFLMQWLIVAFRFKIITCNAVLTSNHHSDRFPQPTPSRNSDHATGDISLSHNYSTGRLNLEKNTRNNRDNPTWHLIIYFILYNLKFAPPTFNVRVTYSSLNSLSADSFDKLCVKFMSYSVIKAARCIALMMQFMDNGSVCTVANGRLRRNENVSGVNFKTRRFLKID